MSGLSTRVRRTVGVASLALLTAGGALALSAAPASAAPTPTRYVAIGGDDIDNDCLSQSSPCETIQYAVNQADPGDTVSVGAGAGADAYAESVHIRIPLTLVGAGSTGSGRTTISGDPESGAPSIWVDGNDTNQPVVVTIRGLDVSGNQNDDGVFIVSATAHIIDSVISDNEQDGVGVEGDGSATIDHSLLTGNRDSGVLLEDAGSVVITDSTLDKNVGAGVVADNSETTATVRNSTISSTVPFDGPGGGVYGGGLLVFGGTAHVQTSTVVDNTGQGVLSIFGQVTVDNSTVSGTNAAAAGGVDLPSAGIVVLNDIQEAKTQARTVAARFPGSSVSRHSNATQKTIAPAADAAPTTSVTGTIDAANTAPDCEGPVVDGGYNASSDTANSCGFSAAKHDLVKTNPKLGPLADNGGPTKTEVLLKGSPAIDAIPSGQAGCAADAADQRGIARPQPTGGACDIGAVELEADPIVIHPDSLPHGTVGEAYSATLTATGGAYPTYVWSLAPGSSLPPGLTLSAGGVISGTPTAAGSFPFTVSVNDPVLKRYTIIIAAAVGPNGNGEPIANTGSNVLPLSTVGGGAVLGGFVLLVGAGLIGRRPGRHRAG
ncbi:MAG: hypothetical protein QOC66_1742 [Pseudonocardiales bacterium]|nr:hypothetical protein [Pseudonocardiales bacterium]